MRVLYYGMPELKPTSRIGGVYMVSYYLTRALSDEVSILNYPLYTTPIKYATNIGKIYSRIARGFFDIFHFNYYPSVKNGSYALFGMAKIKRIPMILSIHGIAQIEYLLDYPRTKQARAFIQNIVKNTLLACKQVNKLVTYSNFMRDQISFWYGVNPDKIAVIPNGVDLQKFSKVTSKKKLQGDPAILYFGYLSNFKGVDILIQAVSKLKTEMPNLKLHLVGHGDENGFREQVIKKMAEKFVVFHGYSMPELAPIYYKSADFCVFPSRRDSFGITLLEAMASGVPLIASNRGGTPEIITHRYNGILFDPADENSLQNAIRELYYRSNLRKRISSNALTTVSRYSWQNIAKRYVILYEDLIGKR